MTIYFHKALKSKWGGLSPMYPSPIIINGVEYPTPENYYQSMKYQGEYAELIRQQETSYKAILLAEKRITKGYWRKDEKKRLRLNSLIEKFNDIPIRKDWEQIKVNVMNTALRIKFFQHPKLEKLLLSTGDEEIVAHRSIDSYWGNGKDGKGQNNLGKLLMQIRYDIGEFKN
uniref:NADAR domain protein n=1 Tax=Iridovirus LCIVAC01 TaxID=2506607 RepID=A0A481YQX7_9VIRU|nr:MAG: NADAR domain protein [Iridovirus LCIVAC01]